MCTLKSYKNKKKKWVEYRCFLILIDPLQLYSQDYVFIHE